ncbi:MAG: M3 family metallopeptidase [Candidatus Velthaea sp.]
MRQLDPRFAGALLCAALVTAQSASRASVPAGPPVAAAVPLAIGWHLTAAQIAAGCKREIARADARITALTRSRSARTFANAVEPLEQITADLNDDTAAAQFLVNVAAEKAVRDASQHCNTDEATFIAEMTARPQVYALIRDAAASGTAHTRAQRKLTDLWLTASFRAGAGLPGAKRREFVALNARLTGLQNRFSENLANDASTIAIGPAQIGGLDPDFVASFKRTDAGYLVPVNESTFTPFLSDADDAAARRAFTVAYGNRAGAANVALLEQAISVRDRLAHLFGYSTWAAYVLDDRMAKTPARVNAFLNNLDAVILPKAIAERDELAAIKGAPIDPWDRVYYENRLRKEKYALDRDEIRRYFPVQHTVDAVLGVYQKLLSVRFTRITMPDVWNDDVVGYDVADARSGALLGRFYLDLYPRPGKYSHVADFSIVPRRKLPDGTVRAPLAAIVGNWTRPAPGKPALLSHDAVQSFFHEFGHNMAAMLATGDYETLTGGFRADFIEAPAQMLENWVWDPAILKEISANVTTGAPLPDDLIKRLIATRRVHYAYETTLQLFFASVDMTYHTRGAHVDTTAVWAHLVSQLTPNAFVPGTHPQASFGHLMAGYDAGYYGYAWSKVYAQDMFSAFESAGLENPIVGMRYRADILAPARAEEPDEEVTRFLGRPMSPSAFYRDLGIAPPGAK